MKNSNCKQCNWTEQRGIFLKMNQYYWERNSRFSSDNIYLNHFDLIKIQFNHKRTIAVYMYVLRLEQRQRKSTNANESDAKKRCPVCGVYVCSAQDWHTAHKPLGSVETKSVQSKWERAFSSEIIKICVIARLACLRYVTIWNVFLDSTHTHMADERGNCGRMDGNRKLNVWLKPISEWCRVGAVLNSSLIASV